MRRYILLLMITGLISSTLPAQMSRADTKNMLRTLQSAPSFPAAIDSLRARDYHPDASSIPAVREALWQRLLLDNDPTTRKTAFQAGKCTFGEGKTGHFTMTVKGERPAAGYPVYIGLHGGGGTTQEVNDEQWQQMASYYLPGIDTGIYIAPRGPNNTWNLHFDGEAQAFYGQLLRDLRLFAGADPNRIYLMGYSAGGDGVYQLAPRMATELAGANMSAGHHNHVAPDNLQHLPMLLQVGELDEAYHRNVETVRYAVKLDDLARRFPGEFTHQVYVHANAQHSHVRDHQGAHCRAPVVADPRSWEGSRMSPATSLAITDAPTWLSPFRRNPHPMHLRWDLGTRLGGNTDWYWVSVDLEGVPKAGEGERHFVEVTALPEKNRIEVKEFHGVLELHLHEALVNPGKPLTVVVEGKEYGIDLKPSMLRMAETMAGRGDPYYSSWQSVRVWRDVKGQAVVK